MSASIALIPVWTGVSTPCRTITPGAIRSTGRLALVSIGPLSSMGRPSGSTTRPSSAEPTGTSTTRPVVLTVSPSLIAVALPRMTAPTVSSSRLRAIADPYDQATQQAGIDLDVELDAAAGELLHPLGERPDLVRAERRGAGGGGEGDALADVVETTELVREAWQLLDPAAPEEQEYE